MILPDPALIPAGISRSARKPGVEVRRVTPTDLDDLLVLMRAHADYERAAPPTATVARLHEAIAAAAPSVLGWVATADGIVIGYLTATRDVSTWRCAPFLHMDCLYVDTAHRGGGVGAQLFAALRGLARAEGVDEIQWQTPEWNGDAARFYRRLGAAETVKRRFALGRDGDRT